MRFAPLALGLTLFAPAFAGVTAGQAGPPLLPPAPADFGQWERETRE